MRIDVEKINKADSFSKSFPFWGLNDKLNEAEMCRQIEGFALQGYGGFFLHSRVGLVTEYLSDEWMRLCRVAVEKAKALDLKVWLYDEDMWPSGYAAGMTVKIDSSFSHMAMVLEEEGNEKETDLVVKRLPEIGKTVLIRRAPAKLDRFNGATYIDTFNPDAVKAFFQTTHEKYARHLGEYFGNTVIGIFTDEPCYAFEFYGKTHVPYSPIVRSAFMREYGWDIFERAEELFFEKGDYRRTRLLYYDLCSRQFCESYVRQYRDWCEAHRLLLSGHLGCEDSMQEMVWAQGSVMPAYEYFHIPGVDKLQRPLSQITTIVQVVSAAEQFGKKEILCECFAGIGNDCGFMGRKRISDWLNALGITVFIPHFAPYSIRGERKRDYPPALGFQQPWFLWEHYYVDYIARVSYLHKKARDMTEILILQPYPAACSVYSPFSVSQEMATLDRDFKELSEALWNAHIPFHYGDDEILRRYASVKRDGLYVGKKMYRTVIVCGDFISADTERLLKRFSLNGNVLFFKTKPNFVDGLKRKVEFAGEIASDVPSLIKSLQERFSFRVTGNRSEQIIGNVKKYGGGRLCMLANPSLTESATVVLSGDLKGKVYQYAAQEGCLRYICDDIRELPPLTLYPTGSVQLLFGNFDGKIDPFQPFGADGVQFGDVKRGKTIAWKEICAMDCNVLPLMRADYYENGEMILKNAHLSEVWHPFFYRLKEQTPFSLLFRFTIEALPPDAFSLVAENAENYDEIMLNGVKLSADRQRGEPQILDDRAYLDPCFTKITVPKQSLKVGENVLVFSGKKRNNVIGIGMHRTEKSEDYAPTEAEYCYLIGRFSVVRRGVRFSVSSSRELTADIAENGYPFYAGRIRASADVSECAGGYIEIAGGSFTSVEYRCSEKTFVRLNPPYVFPVQENDKTAHFVFSNTINNMVGPVYIKNSDRREWIDPAVFNEASLFTEDLLFDAYHIGRLVSIEK